MPTQFDLRGSLTLDEITRALMQKERMGFVRLTKLRAKTITDRPPRTEASFADDDSDELPPDLHLIAVKDGDNLPTIIATQSALSRSLINSTNQPFTIFVQDKKTKVLVFRSLTAG